MRLLTMGPHEIIWRIHQRLIVAKERIWFRLSLDGWSDQKWRQKLCANLPTAQPSSCSLESLWLNHMASREEPGFLLDASSLSQSKDFYQQYFAEHFAEDCVRADRVLRNEFSFFGISFHATFPNDWNRDPVTKRKWPESFYADLDIPFCEGSPQQEPGDSKFVWELNRHEFLVDCAKVFYLTRETKYADHVLGIVTNWITANPYLKGINWAGPLEVAVRSIAWLWSYQFCRCWKEMPSDQHLAWIKSFYEHGSYLFNHLEVYSSPNNHLVGEATALYLLGSFFPEFDQASNWRTHAWNILEKQPGSQFYDDGGSTEQAASYHHYCLGFFLIALLTRRRQGLGVPGQMYKTLEAALEFSMWMTAPDGTVPRIGDTDDARSIRLTTFDQWDFRNLLCIGVVLFDRADFKYVATRFSEDALWLLGSEGVRKFQELAPEKPRARCRVFPDSGYAFIKNNWRSVGSYLCLDGGEIGAGLYGNEIPIFSHGHTDMLSINMHVFGKPLLVDAGFATYNGSPDWHKYSRCESGHNTVRIDGYPQAKFHKKCAWSCVARPGPLHLHECEEYAYIEGAYSTPVGSEGRIRHRRAVVWNYHTCCLICDRIEGKGVRNVEVFFHFAPGMFEIDGMGRGVSIVTDEGVHATLQSVVNELEIEVRKGEPEPAGGWTATGYGCVQPAPVVRFHGCVTLPCTFAFVLSASTSPSPPPSLEYMAGANDATGLIRDTLRVRITSISGDDLLSLRSHPDHEVASCQ